MVIERDNKVVNMENQLFSQLTTIMNQIDPKPVKEIDKTNGVKFISIEDAAKELLAMGVKL
jgi:hypothetical protein